MTDRIKEVKKTCAYIMSRDIHNNKLPRFNGQVVIEHIKETYQIVGQLMNKQENKATLLFADGSYLDIKFDDNNNITQVSVIAVETVMMLLMMQLETNSGISCLPITDDHND